VRRTLAPLVAAAAGAAFVLARRMRRARAGPAAPDPAAELRSKLDESRAIADERDEFESRETPVDEADAPGDVDSRRRAVHDRGRAAADEMRGGGADDR
jgi:hypothetical protein